MIFISISDKINVQLKHFCYICWNCLINKLNTLTKTIKSGDCGCRRTVISPGLPACSPTYLPTCTHSACALAAHDWSLPQGLAAKAGELVAQEWQRKKRKTGEEKAVTKKRLDKARGQTRVNIVMDFQQCRELRELKGLKSDALSTNNSHVGCLCSL